MSTFKITILFNISSIINTDCFRCKKLYLRQYLSEYHWTYRSTSSSSVSFSSFVIRKTTENNWFVSKRLFTSWVSLNCLSKGFLFRFIKLKILIHKHYKLNQLFFINHMITPSLFAFSKVSLYKTIDSFIIYRAFYFPSKPSTLTSFFSIFL